MTKAIPILRQLLVTHFYKVNAGLFLFVFFVLFGAPYSPVAFHLSLITGLIQSPIFLLLVMLLWLLYDLKCIDYVLKQLNDPRQTFLFCLNSLPPRKVYFYLLYVQTLVYMPIIAYAFVIMWVAYKKQQYTFVIEVLFFHIILVAATTFIYVFAIQKKPLINVGFVLPSFSINLPKPLFLIPLLFMLKERKQMLLITKAFSLSFLLGFINLYEPVQYDIRPLQLCLLVVAASHCAIVFTIRSFEEDYLVFSKNLPLTLAGRFIRTAGTYVLLLLPELLCLFKGYKLHFLIADYPQLLLLPLALLCIFHVALLLAETNMEQLIRIVFGIIAACFFIILYNPGTLFPCAILLLAFAFHHSYYYVYEKKLKGNE